MNIGVKILAVAVGCIVLAGGCTGGGESQVNTAAGDLPDRTGETDAVTGRCHCGQVAYAVTGPVVKSSSCDCPGCRKASGSMQADFVTVGRDDFQLRRGELAEFKAEGGKKCDAHGSWLFCPECGTHVYWKPDRGDKLDVFAGTLDDASKFQPGSES
jgi:hypothetical protein